MKTAPAGLIKPRTNGAGSQRSRRLFPRSSSPGRPTSPDPTDPQVQSPNQVYPVRSRIAITHRRRPSTPLPSSLDSLQSRSPGTAGSRYQCFHYACHRLQFTPDLDLFANSENAQVTRFLSAYPMTRSCGVNAFNYDWSEEAGYANPHGHSFPESFESFAQKEHETCWSSPNGRTRHGTL